MIEHALTPLNRGHPHLDAHRLAIAIRAATGIESFVWLVHVDGLPCRDAAEMLCQTARVILTNALATDPPAPVQKLRLQRRGDTT